MDTDTRIVSPQALTAFVTELFTAGGLPAADAALVAKVLVWSNLRGVDSHGLRTASITRRPT